MTTLLPATCFHPRRGWPSAGFIGVRVARVNFTYRSRSTLCALNTFEFIRRGCRGEERGCYLCGMARVTYTQGGITFIRQPVAPFRPKVNSRLTRNRPPSSADSSSIPFHLLRFSDGVSKRGELWFEKIRGFSCRNQRRRYIRNFYTIIYNFAQQYLYYWISFSYSSII